MELDSGCCAILTLVLVVVVVVIVVTLVVNVVVGGAWRRIRASTGAAVSRIARIAICQRCPRAVHLGCNISRSRASFALPAHMYPQPALRPQAYPQDPQMKRGYTGEVRGRVHGPRGEQDGQTGHQYLKRQIWSVGAKNKTHGVSSHAGSFPGLESRF